MQNYNRVVEAEDYTYYWFIDGNGSRSAHRLDGPAVISKRGEKTYIIDNEYMSEEEYYNHPEVIAYANEIKLKKVLGV